MNDSLPDVFHCDIPCDMPNELEEFKRNKELKIIVREPAKELIQICQTFGDTFLSDSQESWDFRRYLCGTGGTGKSTILFLLVYRLRMLENKWLVFYIPKMHELITKTSSDAAFWIMDSFFHMNRSYFDESNELSNFYKKCNEENSYSEHFEHFFSILTRIRDRNVLYAIDQWNAVVNANKSLPNGHILLRFTNFEHNHKNGPFIVAVSSSFDGIGKNVFKENLAEYCKIEIPVFTTEETKTLFDIWKTRHNPVDVSLKESDQLINRTNGICRLLEIFYRCRKKSPKCTPYSEAFEKACVDYYRSRFISCLEKYSEDNNEKKRFFKVIAQILLNKNIERWCITEKLEATGMFVPMEMEIDRSYCKPVCDFVLDAARKYFSKCIGEHLVFFCSSPQTKGYGLELFVFHDLVRSVKSFNTVSLKGKDLGKILLEVNFIEYQDAKNEFSDKYKENTFVVCYPNHPVIDFVYYGKSSLYFIQVSTQKYTEHPKKIPDLFSSNVYGQNVYSYYIKKSPNQRIQKLRSGYKQNGKLGDNTEARNYIRYIYITTSSGKCTGDSSGHDVFQIRGDELQQFGDIWHDIKQHFKSD